MERLGTSAWREAGGVGAEGLVGVGWLAWRRDGSSARDGLDGHGLARRYGEERGGLAWLVGGVWAGAERVGRSAR